MTAHTRMKGAAIVLALTLTAASAHAECAWVLWLEAGMTSDLAHGPESSYQTLQECVSALDQIELRVRQQSPAQLQRLTATSLYLGVTGRHGVKGGIVYMQQWRCLPDTVDPRSPNAAT